MTTGSLSSTNGTTTNLNSDVLFSQPVPTSVGIGSITDHTLVQGHLEATYIYAVRYTARQPGETLPTSFLGMKGYALHVAAQSSYNMSNPTIAVARPDNDPGISLSLTAMYSNSFPTPQSKSIDQTIYVPCTVPMTTSGQIGTTNFKEGYATVKMVMDLTGNGGTAEALCNVGLSQAKGLSVIRSENSGPVTWDDGDALGGFLELDKYNTDGSLGTGNSRFNNDVPRFGYGTATISENWSASSFGTPWPLLNAFNSQYFGRHWHWYGSTWNPQTGQDTGPGYYINEGWTFNVAGYDTPRPHVFWPLDALGNWLPKSKMDTGYPGSVTDRIDLHLSDTDNHTDPDTSPHPERTYDQHADFRVTFHNETEEQTVFWNGYKPTSENPWKRGIFPSAVVALAHGPVTGWSPVLQLGSPDTISYTFNVLSEGAEVAATWTPHDNLATALPTFDIPAGIDCVCYWRPAISRKWYNYKHYLQGGRHIIGFDQSGQEKLHAGFDDYSTSGSNPPSIQFAFMTHNPNSTDPKWTGFPETYPLDIIGAPN